MYYIYCNVYCAIIEITTKFQIYILWLLSIFSTFKSYYMSMRFNTKNNNVERIILNVAFFIFILVRRKQNLYEYNIIFTHLYDKNIVKPI